jgi:hypothetical protein
MVYPKPTDHGWNNVDKNCYVSACKNDFLAFILGSYMRIKGYDNKLNVIST